MKTTMLSRSALSVAVASALIHVGLTWAGGFQVIEICGKCQGLRNAGAVAAGSTASTVFFNPAGMPRLKGKNNVELNLHTILPKFKFKDKHSTNAIGGEPIGDDNNDGAINAIFPNFFYTRHLNDRFTAGVGVSVGPYGLVTKYDKNWIGRYNAIKSDLKTVSINLAIGFEINDHFSVGGGFSAHYVDIELTNALDFGTIGFLAGIPGIRPSHPLYDGFSKLSGDDWGWGWNLGLLFEPRFGTRFGVSYRSNIDHTLEGNVKIIIPSFFTAATGLTSEKPNIKADFTAPAMFMIGGYHEINEKWAIMASAWWTKWDEFDELRVEFEDGRPDLVQPENWDNSWRYAIGVNYKHSSHWTLRAGFEYDESPVKKEDRTPRIPDQDRYWLAMGASYQYSDALSFDLAYTHIFMSDYSIEDTEVTTGSLTGVPVGSTLDGEYESNVNILSLQLTWKF